MDCIDEFNRIYMNSDILAKDIRGSFWKITKLAVVYHMIENPTATLIDSKYVQQSIDFYNRIKPCLQYVIDKKAVGPEEKFKKWLSQKKNGDIFRMGDIRNQSFVKEHRFKKWIDEVFPALQDELGFVYDYSGFGGNTKAYQIVKKKG